MSLLATLHDAIEGAVFGNGWLALGGLAVAVGITLVVRASRGITV
jgi:hypothetical protein